MPPPDAESAPPPRSASGTSEAGDDCPIVPIRVPQPSEAARWLTRPEDPLCFCFGITVGELTACILARRSPRVSDVGEATSAGTACGSCRIEIAQIIEALLGQPADMSVTLPPRKPGP